jgi:hypothetical protein
MPNPTGSASPDVRRSVRAYLDRLERERFYGIVAVRYEAGNPVHIRREESILPTNLPTTENPNNGRRNP